MEKLDILNREEFVNKLVNLTENISANRTSASFAINGAWGCGKSFVLDMYEKQLNVIQSEKTASEKYFVIRYNCWKYDYYEEPLVAIVAAMIDIINQKTKLWNDEKKRARVLGVLKAVGISLLTIGNNAIKDKTGLDIKSAFDVVAKETQKENEKQRKKREYDANFSFNQSLECLRHEIDQLSQEQTIVFMVDELDRCLPEYAIKVLERLHHLTEDASNVITVLAMDKKQLDASVERIFGHKNPEKYLEKFIQFELKLDCGEVSKQVTEKYADYISMFDKDIWTFKDSLEEFIQAIFKNIDARTQEQLVKRATVAHQLLYAGSDKKDYVFMCMELLLTVLICAYDYGMGSFNNPIHLGESQKRFSHIFGLYSQKPEPAFAHFFEQKLEKVNWSRTTRFNNDPTIYVLNNPVSLYGVILYTWYQMHREHPRVQFAYYSQNAYEDIENHHESLLEFAKTVKMLK